MLFSPADHSLLASHPQWWPISLPSALNTIYSFAALLLSTCSPNIGIPWSDVFYIFLFICFPQVNSSTVISQLLLFRQYPFSLCFQPQPSFWPAHLIRCGLQDIPNGTSSLLYRCHVRSAASHHHFPQVDILPWLLDWGSPFHPALTGTLRVIIRLLSLHQHSPLYFVARFLVACVPLLLSILTATIQKWILTSSVPNSSVPTLFGSNCYTHWSLWSF